MTLPPIHIRQIVYKATLVLIPVVTVLAHLGIIPVAVAGAIGTLLGVFSSGLADKASAQLQKDGTLILTGSVQEQVAKGTDILINDAVNTINGLDQVGKNLDLLNQAKDRAITSISEVPVLGPLAKQVLDRLK